MQPQAGFKGESLYVGKNANCSTERVTNNNTLVDGGRFQHHTATLNEPFHDILEARTQSERGYKYKYTYTY